MDREAFEELYAERICPFCKAEKCEKLIKIVKKNMILIKCKKYKFKEGASK